MRKIQKQTLNQTGFAHLLVLVLVIAVIIIVGFVGFKVAQGDKEKTSQPNQTTVATKNTDKNGPVKWTFNEKKLEWFAQTGTPRSCADPFIFDRSPAGLSKMMVVGMPGAYRGYSYKPHGGMRLNNMDSGKVDVVMPSDATLVGLTRYYEGSPAELQYLLTFETDCGIAFRFDHLSALSPAFQKIAEKTPEPKVNDTRTNPNNTFERVAFKSGDLVATEVGFKNTKNFGFDFGTYDYRHRNAISNNAKWADIHNQYQASEWFGTCWITQLPAADAAKAKELSLVVINPAKPNIVSDYCSYAPHTTLEFNDGKPTEG